MAQWGDLVGGLTAQHARPLRHDEGLEHLVMRALRRQVHLHVVVDR